MLQQNKRELLQQLLIIKKKKNNSTSTWQFANKFTRINTIEQAEKTTTASTTHLLLVQKL